MTVEERLALAFIADRPREAARILDRTEPAQTARIIAGLEPELAAAVFRALAPSPAAACSAELDDAKLIAILEELPLDVAAAALRRIDASRREPVLHGLSEGRRDLLRVALSYGENTAAALADPLALALPDDIIVAEAMQQLRSTDHLFYHVFVITRDRTVRGTLQIPELMNARRRQPITDVMRHDVVAIDGDTDLATVAVHPAWRDFDALPVVDGERKFIGAIRHRMIRQMNRETTRPMVETIVGLSELYWVGLSGILTSLTPQPRNGEESDGS